MKNKGGRYNTKESITNPKKTCADCVHHECTCGCMKTPREFCSGYCTLKHRRHNCFSSGKQCKNFKQIDWRLNYDN